MNLYMDYRFSPNFKLDHINQENVIEAFKERIDHHYIKPIEILNCMKLGFAATILISSFIDILAKTENHNTTKESKDNYINLLIRDLGFDDSSADLFYYNFRCGLIHAGCIESGGQISYKQSVPYQIYHGYLSVNPCELFEKIKKKFENFIDQEKPEELFKYLKTKIKEIK